MNIAGNQALKEGFMAKEIEMMHRRRCVGRKWLKNLNPHLENFILNE